jgi:hypothetical protein
MSVLRGHEDLQPKTIVGFDMGYALVQCAGEIKRYKLGIGPQGGVTAMPEVDTEAFDAIDQIDAEQAVERSARRRHDIDQPIE